MHRSFSASQATTNYYAQLIQPAMDPLLQLLCSNSCDDDRSTEIRDDDRSRRRSRSRSAWPRISELRQELAFQQADSADGEREAKLKLAVDEAASLHLPIGSCRSSGCPKAAIEALMSRGDVDAFYIGATVNPRRRWLLGGCQSDERQWSQSGHCHRWKGMWLIDVAENTIGNHAGRVLETSLIKFARANWPATCKNKAEDARGQCNGVNFMYMVWDDGL